MLKNAANAYVDIKHGVLCCGECSIAHKKLGFTIIEPAREEINMEEVAYLSSMGNAKVNSLLEVNLRSQDRIKLRPSCSATDRAQYIA